MSKSFVRIILSATLFLTLSLAESRYGNHRRRTGPSCDRAHNRQFQGICRIEHDQHLREISPGSGHTELSYGQLLWDVRIFCSFVWGCHLS